MSPEGKVKKDVKAFFKDHNWWWCTPATGGYGSSGVPDFIAARPTYITPEMVGQTLGVLVGVETKAVGKMAHVTELQADQLLAINFAGGHGHACDSVDYLDQEYPNG